MKSLLFPIIAALALSTPAFAQSATENAEAAEAVSYQVFARVYPYESSVASRAAAIAVSSIEDARADLAARRYGPARRHLGRASTALSLLGEASPPLRLEGSLIGIHERLVAGAGADPADFVPLYSELDAYGELTEVADVRVAIDRAKAGVEEGSMQVSVDAIEEARASLVYVETDLPLKETRIRVDRARVQMQRKDYLAADATLKDALGHVETLAVAADVEVEAELLEEVAE